MTSTFLLDDDAFLAGERDFDFGRCYYLSGPMAGYENHNFPAFEKAAGELRDAGVMILSPHELTPPIDLPTDADYLKHDFQQMLIHCKGIILLRGWPQSTGARAELEVAMTLKWPVYYYEGWVLHDMNRKDYKTWVN